MTIEELKYINMFYSNAVYIACKWTLTIPAVLIGNALDLVALGIPKRVINVTPVMTSLPFFKEMTRRKEETIANSSFLNKGFAGVARAAVSVAGEIPFNIVAEVAGAILTALHILIAHTIAVPVQAVGEFVARNMFGMSH